MRLIIAEMNKMNITHFKSALTANDILLNIFYNHSSVSFYALARFGTL